MNDNSSSVVGDATRRMIRFLADRTDDGRLVRGHEILDNNQLEDIVIDERNARANVVGTAHYPYVVDMRYAALDRFDERGTRFDCTCPDWGDPCKHGVALALTLAARLDVDQAQGEAVAEERRSADPVATRVEPPSDRPKWAENVSDQPMPVTFDDWLGMAERSRPVPKLADVDPFDTVLGLGRLAISGGPDLAPEIALLASRLRDG
jgi:SWIM zinc finger